jgi:hypothetical protein
MIIAKIQSTKGLYQLQTLTLQKTLNEIERLVKTYYEDCRRFKEMNINEIFDFIKNIPYKADPHGIEFVRRPAKMLEANSGDCDDKTVLFLACLKIKGIACGYSIVKGQGKQFFHHIFPFMVHGNKIIDLDATYPQNIIGMKKNWSMRKNYFLR